MGSKEQGVLEAAQWLRIDSVAMDGSMVEFCHGCILRETNGSQSWRIRNRLKIVSCSNV